MKTNTIMNAATIGGTSVPSVSRGSNDDLDLTEHELTAAFAELYLTAQISEFDYDDDTHTGTAGFVTSWFHWDASALAEPKADLSQNKRGIVVTVGAHNRLWIDRATARAIAHAVIDAEQG